MASTLLQAERFVKIINQQMEILKDESNTVTAAANHRINQVESEVKAWINGGQVNHTTYAEMNNRIPEILSLFIDKAVELSGKQIYEHQSELNKEKTTNNWTSPGASLKVDEIKTEPLIGSCETVQSLGVSLGSDASHNMTMRFAILEEAVNSLKKKTKKVEDKIENVDKILKDVLTQQVNDHKKEEVLTNAKLKSEKKIKDKITDLEKRCHDFKSNVDNLFETVTNVDDKLNRLEEENKSVTVSMNELNKQISSVRTCSNDALMSIQCLSMSVESTNQHYNEMSNKMNQLEISFNLISSQYTEQFKNMSSLNKDKADDLIGMVCQLLAKRLTPLEKLNETLNKKVNSGDQQLSKKDSIESRVAEMSNKITEIELKCSLPKVGFLAWKNYNLIVNRCTIPSYDGIHSNYGGHFDQSTGIFTAPKNGLYLITIITLNPSNTNTSTIFCYCNYKAEKIKRVIFHSVSKNQTITRIAEITAGDELYLEWQTDSEHNKSLMCINFSCYLVQMWR